MDNVEFAEGPQELSVTPAYSSNEVDMEMVEPSGSEGTQPDTRVTQGNEGQDGKVSVDQKELNRLYYNQRTSEKLLREQDQKMNYMMSIFANAARAQQEAAAQAAAPDPEDVAGTLKWQMDQLAAQQRALLEQSQKSQEAQAHAQLLQGADSQIGEFLSEAPEVYTAAMTHLAKIVRNDVATQFAHLSDEQQVKIAADAIAKQKREIYRSGGNVGEYLFQKALLYGFNPNGVQMNGKQEPQGQQKAKVNGKETIAAEKKKAGNGSIGNLQSAPAAPGAFNPKQRMTEAEYHKKMSEMIKNKQVRTDKTGRKANITDLLASKAYKISN